MLDDGLVVGRVYRINASVAIWWWGISFRLTGRKSYGDARTREEAMAAFRAEYEHWQREKQDGR